jgi:sugar-specific transcriptional regulator TrmB
MILHQLTNLGLTEKEARLYLASIRTGAASMLTLSRKAKIDRGTAYHVALTMGDKGLFEQIPTEGKPLYRATHPSCLYRYIQDQYETARQRMDSVKAIEADLNELFEATSPEG